MKKKRGVPRKTFKMRLVRLDSPDFCLYVKQVQVQSWSVSTRARCPVRVFDVRVDLLHLSVSLCLCDSVVTGWGPVIDWRFINDSWSVYYFVVCFVVYQRCDLRGFSSRTLFPFVALTLAMGFLPPPPHPLMEGWWRPSPRYPGDSFFPSSVSFRPSSLLVGKRYPRMGYTSLPGYPSGDQSFGSGDWSERQMWPCTDWFRLLFGHPCSHCRFLHFRISTLDGRTSNLQSLLTPTPAVGGLSSQVLHPFCCLSVTTAPRSVPSRSHGPISLAHEGLVRTLF